MCVCDSMWVRGRFNIKGAYFPGCLPPCLAGPSASTARRGKRQADTVHLWGAEWRERERGAVSQCCLSGAVMGEAERQLAGRSHDYSHTSQTESSATTRALCPDYGAKNMFSLTHTLTHSANTSITTLVIPTQTASLATVNNTTQ